jgi:hypothetical protein
MRLKCTTMRAIHVVLLALTLIASNAFAQTTAPPAGNGSTAPVGKLSANPWRFDGSLQIYFLPDQPNLVVPNFDADRGRLHLEGRYNDEARNTASLWLGANFGGGRSIAWTITPMLGAALGATPGVLAGYEGALTWRKFDVYSEGEYFRDVSDSSGSFLYNWSEFSIAPAKWLRLGLAVQRTRVYATERDVQRGPLAGLSYKWFDVTMYVYNPDDAKPVFILGIIATF